MHRTIAALALLLALMGCTGAADGPATPPPEASQITKRATDKGDVVGHVDNETGAHVWRAIPFAAPPVGDRRWRAPRGIDAWPEPLLAVQAPPRCLQMLSPLDQVPQSQIGDIVGDEDCLYLDVYAPPLSDDERAAADLPVMVWIHGGSNIWGYADQYNGATLATQHNVVVVVIQYRLGAFGWFSHPAIEDDAKSRDDASANFGMLDQIAALRWVKRDIAAFGGDPDLVTIFGESAGGMDVAGLLVSPRADGLFQRAIIQSGGFDSISLDEAREGTKDSAIPAGRRIANAVDPDAAALRAAPADAVI
ncbi:MAG: carboxylesterase family protein, partial [Pseudomonadota bacterium]